VSLHISKKNNSKSIFDKEVYLNFAKYILSCQDSEGGIRWEPNSKLDPWDHIESAMGLDVLGFEEQSNKAYEWLRAYQENDGSWLSLYHSSNKNDLKETNYSSYIAVGMWHHFLNFNNVDFLNEFWPVLDSAIEFTLSAQSKHGDFFWAKDKDNWLDDSLKTGCSSILMSLICYKKIAKELNLKDRVSDKQLMNLKDCLRNKPLRFDRNWESKSRYSMDWYYPVLSGAFSKSESTKILSKKWDEFVVDGLGCKCVTEEPWVTAAESSELVISLTKSGLTNKAEELLQDTFNLMDEDGLLWTGYVFKDEKFWPVEKPSWTMGAAILAGNSINKFSPSSNFFEF